jgi:predicted nucleotide-binding protein
MATISPELLAAIRKKTGLGSAAVYARIQQTATSEFLPRNLAAIKVAADEGVAINRYAKPDELAQLRQAGAPVAPPIIPSSSQPNRKSSSGSTRLEKRGRKPIPDIPNQVFVVHGRDLAAKAAVFEFIRAVGVKPIEWTSAIAMSKKAAPYIGEVLTAAFKKARAVVVLLTPDDLAQLRPELLSKSDPPFERNLTGQARPNVLFECGMAFSSHPDRTVMVQIGSVRPFSDTYGRHIVNMTAGEASKRQEFAVKLQNAGCEVDMSGSDWMTVGDFSDPLMKAPTKRKRS